MVLPIEKRIVYGATYREKDILWIKLLHLTPRKLPTVK